MGLLADAGPMWCLYFFRVPRREAPSQKGVIVSAADGRVVSVQEVVPPEEFGLGEKPRTRISVFLNIFDVHINYIPVSGEIMHVYYQQGHFFHAAKDKASEHNEKNALVIKLPFGDNVTVGVVQIAGLVARRIRCDVRRGDFVSTGQYYGLIRFGSRTEIYLPEGVQASVAIGDKVHAAKTILADLALQNAECLT
ncbi:phosphatidylserine decarboxylase proenzyme [Alphaproteobacteria bacterium]|nr:phosphatidylserine decarboxylase proenzyme [Alphaproteobacteria bacterium]GHS97920.1 phosphatidylserine decarboxylase proenzyme [Alphaproteobacteria bacterium]